MQFKNELLLSLRKTQKLSRKALGELAGVSGQAIWKIESGRTTSPDIATINALAEALGSPAKIFFTFDTHVCE